MARNKSSKTESTANLGFEQKLWLAADELRKNMDAAEYSRAERDRLPKATRRADAEASVNHVVLGLIFLKYISDTFDEHHAKLIAGEGDYAGANPEDKDEYLAANVFWVPLATRWPRLQSRTKLPSIGKDVDDPVVVLERDNPRSKGALNKNYGRADLDTAQRGSAIRPREAISQSLSAAKDKHRLAELIDLIGSIQLADVASRSKDLVVHVFEYFLTMFAKPEGKKGGQLGDISTYFTSVAA
jgi:type I restriction enzyme M protein